MDYDCFGYQNVHAGAVASSECATCVVHTPVYHRYNWHLYPAFGEWNTNESLVRTD